MMADNTPVEAGAVTLGGQRWLCLRGRALRQAERARELHLQHHCFLPSYTDVGLTIEEAVDALHVDWSDDPGITLKQLR